MPVIAHNCPKLPQIAPNCPKQSKIAQNCLKLPNWAINDVFMYVQYRIKVLYQPLKERQKSQKEAQKLPKNCPKIAQAGQKMTYPL